MTSAFEKKRQHLDGFQKWCFSTKKAKRTWFAIGRVAAMNGELARLVGLEAVAEREARRSVRVALAVELQHGERRAVRVVR